jgi:hypothetical protein
MVDAAWFSVRQQGVGLGRTGVRLGAVVGSGARGSIATSGGRLVRRRHRAREARVKAGGGERAGRSRERRKLERTCLIWLDKTLLLRCGVLNSGEYVDLYGYII